MKECLLLFTKKFPFGVGEEFIEREIEALSTKFKVIYVISCQTSKRDQLTKKIPSNVIALRIIDYNSSVRYLYYTIKSFLTPSDNILKTELNLHRKKIGERLFIRYYYSRMITAFKEIKDILTKYDLDEKNIVLYSYWFYDTAHIAMLIRDRLYPSALVFSRAHGYDLYTYRNAFNYIPFRDLCVKKIDYIATCSQNGMNWLIKHHPIYKNKIHTHYLGTSDFGNQCSSSSAKFHIVTCSNLTINKRVICIAKALKALQDYGLTNIQWTCFGDGDQMAPISSYVRKNLSYTEICFMGYVKNEKIMEFYKNTYVNVFVNVSSSEGLPVSIMEAASFGIPIIATNVGGTNEIVLNNENGFLLDEKEPETALVSKLLEMIYMTNDDYSSLRNKSREIWESKFKSEQNYTEFSEILQTHVAEVLI